jgi:hypothetical protein
MNIETKICKKVLLIPFGLPLHPKSQAGSVAVVVALSMIVLLAMFAFVIDAGYLYGQKNKFQNGVEAAAMAGAVSLCDGDPDWVEGVARQVAVDNGLPAGSITVQVGFYDEKDLYEDFPVYKDFVWEGGAGYPEDEFNNAVMVKLNATEETLMGGFVGKDEVNIGASAVAYLPRYGLLSYGDPEDNESDIETIKSWADNNPSFMGMGRIHANNNINFRKEPAISEDTIVTAGGEINNCSEGIAGVLPVDIVRPVDWDRLKNGAVIIDRNSFPDAPSGTAYKTDSDGNKYYYLGLGGFLFVPHDGDHEGITYFVDNSNFPEGVELSSDLIEDTRAYHFTLASEGPINFTANRSGGAMSLGGENENTVYIYCKDKIGGGLHAQANLSQIYLEGVFFYTEDTFRAYMGSSHGAGHLRTDKLRVIAKKGITFQGSPFGNTKRIISGKFGLPCGTMCVRLGRL